ncbi:MAG: Imidazoleglycerol-phosphate dehydratase [Deferribacteraceae bacterium]|nr:Imidazoleglycerol-phosphate dehydratase [Deferribacteraceae bacterium]
MRKSSLKRATAETEVFVEVNLDGTGEHKIDTGIGFFDHMLELFSKHSNIDLTVKVKGDTHIDYHHTVEDTAIVLGQCILGALGDKKGINRYGFFLLPMDETLIECAMDLSGRTYFNYDVAYFTDKAGEFDVELVEEFFRAFSDNLKANIHIVKRFGKNTHHIAEAVFKAVARSLRMAVSVVGEGIPSTKGVI